MKIYLIAPKNPESFWTFDRILPSLNKRCLFPNLSLPTVAGITPREHEVVLCDENVEPIDFDTDADIVGLTGYVVHEKRIFELAEEFRRRGKFVVAGGPLASLCPEKLRDRVDVVFVDEAEYTWPQFLADYATGEWKSEYSQHEKPSMHDSPLPRFDLLEIDQYRTMTIQFARGCPFNCEFCDIIVIYGRKPRTKTVAQVMAEVREIHRLGVHNIFVVDDKDVVHSEPVDFAHLGHDLGHGLRAGLPAVYDDDVAELAVERAAARELDRHRAVLIDFEQVEARQRRIVHARFLVLAVFALPLPGRVVGKELRPGIFRLVHEDYVHSVAQLLGAKRRQRPARDDEFSAPAELRRELEDSFLVDDVPGQTDDIRVGVEIDRLDVLVAEHDLVLARRDPRDCRQREVGEQTLLVEARQDAIERPEGLRVLRSDQIDLHGSSLIQIH